MKKFLYVNIVTTLFIISCNKVIVESEPEIFVTDTVELWYLNGMKDTIEIERPVAGKYKLEYSVAHNHYLVLTDKHGFYIKDFPNIINYKSLSNGQTKK